jgi:hypothetical protein
VVPGDVEPEPGPVTCAVPAAPRDALRVAPAGLGTVALRVTEPVFELAGTDTSASRLLGAAGVPGPSIVQVEVPKPVTHSGLLNTAVGPVG